MKIGDKLRLEYDDQIIDVIDKINDALEEHGLRFESDELPHDGFEILTLAALPPSGKIVREAHRVMSAALWSFDNTRPRICAERAIEAVLPYLRKG